jgi:hypothetical protein
MFHQGECCCAALLPVAEPCTVGGTCLPGGGNVLHTINFNRFPYAISVERGGLLVFGYVQLFNLAPAAAYTYSASTPWRSTGQGTTSWPSIGLAPNATVCVVICLCGARQLPSLSGCAGACITQLLVGQLPVCLPCIATWSGSKHHCISLRCIRLMRRTVHNVHHTAACRRTTSTLLQG